MDKIVHICEKSFWAAAQEMGEYRTASMDQEGFIHCSRPEQVLRVANTFYPGLPDLVLLWIEPQKLVAELHWEPSDGDIFPHLYGPLNLDAVIKVVDFPPGNDGIFRQLGD